jgi:hypothetical protein
VVISLVYLAIQVRQNSKTTRAEMFQRFSLSLQSDLIALGRDPLASRVWNAGLRSWDDLSEEEQGQLSGMLTRQGESPRIRAPAPTTTSLQNARCSTFHRVGSQDRLPLSPQVLRSGRLLPFWLGGLESRLRSRSPARAAAGRSRVARCEDSVRGQPHIAIRWLVCSAPPGANHPSIWASVGHRFVGFFGGA